MLELAIELYTSVLEMALPIAIFFELANIVVSTFLRVAFGGKLWFGR